MLAYCSYTYALIAIGLKNTHGRNYKTPDLYYGHICDASLADQDVSHSWKRQKFLKDSDWWQFTYYVI